MNNIKLSLRNASLDFCIKSYLLLLFVPKATLGLFIVIAYLVGGTAGMWNKEGVFSFIIIGGFAGIFGYFFGLILVTFFVGFFNQNLLSGKRVPNFNKFPKLTLFIFSILAYLATMWVLAFFI